MKNDNNEDIESVEDKLKRFNISSLSHTFEGFRNIKGTREVVKVLKQLAKGESDKKFILLVGATGSGKTHLIEATIIEWAKTGAFAYYRTMSEIVRRLKTSLSHKQEGAYDMAFKGLCDVPRLIIDDYGMGTTETAWEESELEDIINERYHKRYWDDGKVTIMATNKDLKDLPERVVSRFYDPEFGAVLFLEAKDHRRREL
jgi:DNA replication protein DnaC